MEILGMWSVLLHERHMPVSRASDVGTDTFQIPATVASKTRSTETCYMFKLEKIRFLKCSIFTLTARLASYQLVPSTNIAERRGNNINLILNDSYSFYRSNIKIYSFKHYFASFLLIDLEEISQKKIFYTHKAMRPFKTVSNPALQYFQFLLTIQSLKIKILSFISL